MKWRRPPWYAIVALVLAVVAAAVIWRYARNEPLRIGGVLSLTGGGNYPGQEVRDGAQLAIDEINAWGGLNGRRLELVVEDSASNPEAAKKAFLSIESKYHPLFYFSTVSTASAALVPLAEAARVVLVGLVVTNASFPGQSEWAFRYYPTAEDDIAPIVPIFGLLKIKKLGIVYLNDEFGNSIRAVLTREIAGLGGEVSSVSYAAGTVDFAPVFDKLGSFDALYINGFIPHLEAIFTYLAGHPVAKPMFSNNASTVPRVMGLPMMNDVYVAAPLIYNESFPFAAEVRQKYERRYQKPFTHFAANGYDFVKLIAGLLEGGRETRAHVKAALEKGFRYPGILGEISVEPGAHSMSFPQHPAQIVDGKAVYLNLDLPVPLKVSENAVEGAQ